MPQILTTWFMDVPLTRLGSNLENASLVGANTVNGPSAFKASIKSACLSRLIRVVASSSCNHLV